MTLNKLHISDATMKWERLGWKLPRAMQWYYYSIRLKYTLKPRKTEITKCSVADEI